MSSNPNTQDTVMIEYLSIVRPLPLKTILSIKLAVKWAFFSIYRVIYF